MKYFCWALLPFALVVLLALACCSACSGANEEAAPENDGLITLMTWNVNNLFDGSDNGFEYDEFKESSGWSNEKYLGRVNVISGAIGQIQPPPDIIMFQEIESVKVINDVAKAMSGGDYAWSHFSANPGAALGLGLFSRLPILETRAHSVNIDGDVAPRPVLEARIKAADGEFVLFVCHWKSKLGDEETTEKIRRSSARVIVRRIRELLEEESGLGVIVAGDLNENHDEFFRQGAKTISALLPDDPYCAELTGCIGEDGENPDRQKDFIVISKNKPPLPDNFPQESIVLFSPWLGELENGSYFYKYNWETIDHFLVSGQFFDGEGWEYEKTITADFSPFVNANGIPISYNSRTGTGISDHLPLLMTLKLADSEKELE